MPRPLLIVILLLSLTSLLPAKWSARITAPPRAVVGFFTLPLLDVASRWRTPRNPAQSLDLAVASAQALRYTRQLEQQLIEANRLIAQLTAVRELIGDSRVRLTHARAVAITGTRASPVIRLNRGAGADLMVGDVVSDGVQVIGRVASLDAVSCTVTPVTAAKQELLVRFAPRDGAQATREVVALATAAPGGQYLLAVVGKDEPVEVGDLVHLDDPAWPRSAWGLMVGQVTGIDDLPTDPTLRSRVFIEPLSPPDRLGDVIVWTALDES